jgi:plasmid stability protein
MAALSIRDLDDAVRERLRIRAAHNHRSMEAEVRAILTEAVSQGEEAGGLGHALLRRFGELGGVALEVPARSEPARAASFGSDPPEPNG